MDIDLNIDNYTSLELLELFRLPQNYTQEQLKQAKKIVLKMHPDKSGLNKDYFLFFSKAYKTILKINEFKFKSTQMLQANIVLDQEKYRENDIKEKKESSTQKLVNKISKSNNFNEKFNELFVNNYINQEDDDGHGDWLTENNNVSDKEAFEAGKEKFKEFKKHAKAIVEYNEPMAFGNNNFGTSLDNNNNYGAGDLRDVYERECVFNIDEGDMDKNKPKNLDEIKRTRTDIKPLDKQTVSRMLANNQKNDDIMATQRAARLIEQEDKYKKQSNKFMSGFLRLTN